MIPSFSRVSAKLQQQRVPTMNAACALSDPEFPLLLAVSHYLIQLLGQSCAPMHITQSINEFCTSFMS